MTSTQEELEVADCWEAGDRVPGRPDTTAFRRRARLQQARWREAHGHPIGTQPIRPQPGKPVRPVGSRLPLDYARETGATFLTPAALDAARTRSATTEPEQSVDAQRTWADLLSSEALSFNLFGDLASDLALADRAVHAWWSDTPGVVGDVRFAHSPGRLDREFIGSLVAFDVAVGLDLGDGTEGVVAIDVKYHERNKREAPKATRLARYREVAERSGAFASLDVPGELVVMWLEHLLALSMVQHPSGEWAWCRYVVVHPAGNTDIADATLRYRELLTDESTFASITLEELLDSGALPEGTSAAIRRRYLW